MTLEFTKHLGELKGAWMIGGSVMDRSPPAWRVSVQEDPEPELAMVALFGQAIQFALQRVPGSELQAVPPLPPLRLPPPPQPVRQQLSYLVRVVKLDESQMADVIHLLAARGYAMHPFDYLPRNVKHLPNFYAPWDAWLRSEASGETAAGDIAITRENWDEWSPADRRVALSLLRRQDPGSARELIAAKGASLPAEERLRMIELLSDGLSSEDQSLLEGFAEDRSSKVRQQVQQWLARIGVADEDPSEMSEYANFFTVTRKQDKGGSEIKANPLKTDAQKKRREELATKLSLRSMVKGLGLSDEAELVQGWKHSDPVASDQWVRMVAATGSDSAVSMVATKIASLSGVSIDAFKVLFERLGRESRLEWLPQILQNDDASFSASLLCCQGVFGEIPWRQIEPLKQLQDLIALSEKKSSADSSRRDTRDQQTLRQGLYALGLLVDQEAAAKLLEQFTKDDLFASDPMLGILKLNQCLLPGESL